MAYTLIFISDIASSGPTFSYPKQTSGLKPDVNDDTILQPELKTGF